MIRKTAPAARPSAKSPIPPKRLGINCPDSCSLRPAAIGEKNAAALLAARANGAGAVVFQRRASELLGYSVPSSNVQRHLHHYIEAQEPDPFPEGSPKPTDIEILDSIIVSGFRNSRNWKPSIRDTLEAMKLKIQMTGNSAFDDLIALFDVDDEDEPVGEAPEAVLSADELVELSGDIDEDLDEPLAGE